MSSDCLQAGPARVPPGLVPRARGAAVSLSLSPPERARVLASENSAKGHLAGEVTGHTRQGRGAGSGETSGHLPWFHATLLTAPAGKQQELRLPWKPRPQRTPATVWTDGLAGATAQFQGCTDCSPASLSTALYPVMTLTFTESPPHHLSHPASKTGRHGTLAGLMGFSQDPCAHP